MCRGGGLPSGRLVKMLPTLERFGIDIEPAAFLGALFIIGRREDIDELSQTLRLESVDIAFLGSESGHLAFAQSGAGCFLEQDVFV